MTNPRRAFIMDRTATARAKYVSLEEKLHALRDQEREYDYPCAALTRISDQIWDVTARMNAVHNLLMAECKLAAADWDNARCAA